MNVKMYGIAALLLVSMTMACTDEPQTGLDIGGGNTTPRPDMMVEEDMTPDMEEPDMAPDMEEPDMEEDMGPPPAASVTGTWEVSLDDGNGMAGMQVATMTFADETEVGGPQLLAYTGTFTMSETDFMGDIDMAQLAEMNGTPMLSVAWKPTMGSEDQAFLNMTPYNDGGETDENIIRGKYVNTSGLTLDMVMTRQEQ